MPTFTPEIDFQKHLVAYLVAKHMVINGKNGKELIDPNPIVPATPPVSVAG